MRDLIERDKAIELDELIRIYEKGKCTACDKLLGDEDGIFLCKECREKETDHEQRTDL